MSIEWTDVTGWSTLWAPDQGPDITAAVTSQLQDGLAKGAVLASGQYSFTDQAIGDLMHQIAVAQPDSRLLFDESCCQENTKQRNLVLSVIDGLQDDQWAIGNTAENQIEHLKGIGLLYPDGTGWTFSGSFNLTSSAERELNVADLIWSRSRAEKMMSVVQTELTGVRTRQPTQPPAWNQRLVYNLVDAQDVTQSDDQEHPEPDA